jgi:GntR family transcriptional regulator/MocR family aminotransferase
MAKIKIDLQKASSVPLQRQICAQIRKLISEQVLKPGQTLPSSRSLAHELGVARNTVINSYAQLCSEGLIESEVGTGTKVSQSRAQQIAFEPEPEQSILPLSSYGVRVERIEANKRGPITSKFNFLPGMDPSMHSSAWTRLLAKYQRSAHAVTDGEAFQLRHNIATFLNSARRTRATADQVILFHNMEQALDLLCGMHINPGDQLVLENPCSSLAREVFEACGATFVPPSAKAKDILGEKLGGIKSKLAYITPGHQFPSGAVMSEVRRERFLAWARLNRALIVEDDRGFEYRYAGSTPNCMQGMASGQVIYLGDFANPIPEMTLSYLVVPEQLISPYRAALQMKGIWLPVAERRALSDFIGEGYLQRHIQAQGSLLNKRRVALIYHLRRLFGNSISIRADMTAAHISVKFNSFCNSSALVQNLHRRGVHVDLMEPSFEHSMPSTLILGYGRISENNIEEGVEIISETIKSHHAISVESLSAALPTFLPSMSFPA